MLIPGVVGGEPPHPFLTPVVQTDPQAFTELRDQVSDDTVEIMTSQTNVLAIVKTISVCQHFLQIFSYNFIFSDFKYFKFVQWFYFIQNFNIKRKKQL